MQQMFHIFLIGGGVFGTLLLVHLFFAHREIGLVLRLLVGAAWFAAAAGVAWLSLKVSVGFAVAMLALLYPLLRIMLEKKYRQRRQQHPAAGVQSHLSSLFFAVTVAHDTGRMEGRVIQGEYNGRRLQDLNEAALQKLWDTCLRTDPPSAALLEAWLDRHGPQQWRSRFRANLPAPTGGNMTRQEALAVLGLADGADVHAVRDAHKKLMLKNHPDQGGSTYLATKINQAKDLLLK